MIATSVTFAPRARMAVKASCPGVSRKVILRPLSTTLYAPMCCVIPPASPSMTLVLRILSSSDVLPWSTCPMTVTIGGRGTRDASSSTSSSAIASWMSADTNSTLYPNSSATTTIASASRRWLIETIRPRFMQAEITSLTETSIIVASSLTVTNSVTLRIERSFCSRCISSFRRSATSSRFSLRYLAPFDLAPFEVRRASVSFTCFATSSSLTSGRTTGFTTRAPFFLLRPSPGRG